MPCLSWQEDNYPGIFGKDTPQISSIQQCVLLPLGWKPVSLFAFPFCDGTPTGLMLACSVKSVTMVQQLYHCRAPCRAFLYLLYILVKARPWVVAICKIKHEVCNRDANKAWGEPKCFIGPRGSAPSALILRIATARPCFNCLKDLYTNALKTH